MPNSFSLSLSGMVLLLVFFSCTPEKPEMANGLQTIADAVDSVNANNATEKPTATYRIEEALIPEQLHFAGEPVPLDDPDVLERLDRELLVNMYWQSQTVLFHKRAARWFPIIEPILEENNIPNDFKYLAVIESGLQQVVSPSGAAGFWQFMRSTGGSYDLEITDEVDERYHVEKATKAACSYLQAAYDKFGSWTAAAASYNMGKGGLNNQMTKQLSTNYYDLLLNRETSRYVFRILAVKAIMNNSEAYGFYLDDATLYAPFDCEEVIVDSTIANIAEWAKAQNTTYKTVKLFNPWLRQNQLTVGDMPYTLKMPKEQP